MMAFGQGVTDQVLYSGGQIAEGDYFRNDGEAPKDCVGREQKSLTG